MGLLASTCMRGSSPATHLPSRVPSLNSPTKVRCATFPFPIHHHQTITIPRSLPSVPSLPFLFSIFSREPSEPATAAVIIYPSVVHPIPANEFEDVALIGGGSGITPLYQLVNHALNDPTTLLYANVTEADILLRDELDALQRAHPHTFKVVHTLDKPPTARWTSASGYVSREFSIWESDKNPSVLVSERTKVYLCT